MTPTELKRIASKLSNQCFTRYWLHYNYPADPPIMMIAIFGNADINKLDQEMAEKGFKFDPQSEFVCWTIERTDLEIEAIEEGDRP
ncbi:MAG: hypothetical protein HY785_24790 [Oscillatoriophycideae cyanobacterium NC_groundwater_1537_Pr4_S-0.65um_50_18]|nr:hypothetical protein [Oscillatoriophycideae cyanobacterium NC_groundwater_1537_Pr4_S-0.65um_50_18]